MFHSLRNHHNLRLLLLGRAANFTGEAMQATAQSWLVLDLTDGSGTAVGITSALQVLPTVLFGLNLSVLADRASKRHTIMICRTVMCLLALMLGLLTVTGAVTVWHVYALAFCLGVAKAVDLPASMAIMNEVVGRDNVGNANGLNSAVFNVTLLLGSSLAGVLIADWGTGPLFFVSAASFVALVAGLSCMRKGELYAGEPRAKGRLREILDYIRSRPDLLMVLTASLVVYIFGMNYAVTNALMSRNVFHTEASAFGLVTAATAAGGLVGALLSALRKRPTMRGLVLWAAVFAALVALGGVMPVYWAFVLMQVPTAIAMTMFITAAYVYMNEETPDEMCIRVMGLYGQVTVGGSSIGYPMVGWMADAFGVRSSLVIGGLATLALVGGIVAFMPNGLNADRVRQGDLVSKNR